jgi:hypothetical protein
LHRGCFFRHRPRSLFQLLRFPHTKSPLQQYLRPHSVGDDLPDHRGSSRSLATLLSDSAKIPSSPRAQVAEAKAESVRIAREIARALFAAIREERARGEAG